MQFEELLCTLRSDYPDLVFKNGKKFMYRPPHMIYFEQLIHDNNSLQLLHEVGHAILKHRDYATDPERLKMERAAWEQACQLCARYNIYYDEEFVEAELDTYRDWLHQKSRCKRCGLTCYQLKTGAYRCPRCDDLLAG